MFDLKKEKGRKELHMNSYVVRVSYDWVIPTFRDVELSAETPDVAVQAALELARSDSNFWVGALECDGEAGPTNAVAIDADGD